MTIYVWNGEWVSFRAVRGVVKAMALAQFLSTCYARVMVKRDDEFLFYAREGELQW